MKYIPILFSTLMVQALLAGRKTMTRRVIKPKGKNVAFDISMHTDGSNKWPRNLDADERFISYMKCPYGKVGDVLWVRETFTEWPKGEFQYKAGTAFGEELGKWKPNIHMPKEACRLFLEITNIRVERLQDISEQDAIAEGVEVVDKRANGIDNLYKNYLEKGLPNYLSPEWSFMSLWESINGPKSWEANPWVWVIEFKVIDKPNNFK